MLIGLWFMLIIGLNSKITDEFYISKKTVLIYALFSGHSSLPPVENLKFKCCFPGETSNAILRVCDLESVWFCLSGYQCIELDSLKNNLSSMSNPDWPPRENTVGN
jgi:hypothetical protein